MWNSYVRNGFVWPTPEFPDTNPWGLETKIRLNSTEITDEYPFGTELQTFTVEHSAASDDYIFEVEILGVLEITDEDGTYQDTWVQVEEGIYYYQPMYFLQFDDRSSWRSIFLEQPHFQGEPVPSAYHGKTADELLSSISAINQTVSLPPGNCLQVDHSPELRSHPEIDRFVSDSLSGEPEQDALFFINFVINEISLIDYISFREDGTIEDQSVNLGDVNRGALATFLEGQGSPTEQCALLVYLLRKSGIPACYQFPEDNQLIMLDEQLSRIFRTRVKGMVDNLGDPAVPAMIPVNYPWVAVHVNGEWKHVFPWIKDTEIKEGYNLYEFMPESYNSPSKWAEKYLNHDSAIFSLVSPENGVNETPESLFPRYLEKQLQLSRPDLSVADLGVTFLNRKQNYTSWSDLPKPYDIAGTPQSIEKLSDLANIFGLFEITLASRENPSKQIVVSNLKAVDLHNRQLYVRFDRTGPDTHDMILTLEPFSDSHVGPDGNFSSSDLLNRQIKTLSLNSQDSLIDVTIEHDNFNGLAPGVTIDERWDSFMGYTGVNMLTSDTIPKGDVVALCLNLGRVTRRMTEIHARQFWKFEQLAEANRDNPGFDPDEDIYLGKSAYLLGMSFNERVTQFSEKISELHKSHIVSRATFGLAGLRSQKSAGQLPNQGEIILDSPYLNFTFASTAYLGNASLRPDLGDNAAELLRQHTIIDGLNISAYEHKTIESFFNLEDAASTVKLLHKVAQDSTTYPGGNIELNVTNFMDYQNQIQSADPLMWDEIQSYFNSSEESSYHARAYVTPESVSAAGGNYSGMGLFIEHPNATGALITSGLNGGFGALFPSLDAFTVPNTWNLSLSYDFTGGLYLDLMEPSAATPSLSPTTYKPWDVTQVSSFLDTGAFTLDFTSVDRFNSTSSLLNLGTSPDLSVINNSLFDTGINFTSISYLDNPAQMIADPVHVITGAFYIDAVDLKLAGPFPLEVRRNYYSQDTGKGRFGYGWKINMVPYLVFNDDESLLYAVNAEGSVIAYRRDAVDPNLWEPNATDNPGLHNISSRGIGGTGNPFNAKIIKSTPGADTYYTLSQADGSIREYRVRSFPVDGIDRERPYLEKWSDAQGNYFTFSFYEDSSLPEYGELKKIQSSNGTFLGFYYDTAGLVTEVYSSDGRRLFYRYDEFGDLREVTLPDGNSIFYDYEHDLQMVDGVNEVYSKHLIVRETKPEGRILENDYDAERRVSEQRATAGNDFTLVRNATFLYNHTVNGDGTITGTTTIQDALHTTGNPRETVYTIANSLVTRIDDPEGNYMTQDWYAPGDGSTGAYPRSLKYRIDKRGLRTDYAYDSNGNPETLTVTGDITGDGSSDVATTTTLHNSLNLPSTITDPVNNQTKLFYTNTDYPYLPTRIERHAPGGMISQTVNTYHAMVNGTSYPSAPPQPGAGQRAAYGLLKSVSRASGSPDEATDTYTHNDQGFITGSTRPSGTSDPAVTLSFKYNARGELEQRTDAAGRYTKLAYDGLGNRIWQERYDASDNLVWWNYDYYNGNGDLEWTDGPRYYGASSGAEDYIWRKYDGAGRLAEKIQWRSEARSDGSGTQAVSGDSLYATTFYDYSTFGDLLEVRDPNTNLTKMAYDKIGRMTDRWVYDGPSDSDTLLSHEIFDHEPGGLVSSYTNPKTGVTTTLYTATGKPRQQSNPDNTILEWRYYLDGRVQREPLNHNLYWDITYDDLNRTVTKDLTGITGGVIATRTEVYDRRGNLTSWTDLEGHTFSRSYDDLDRIKSETGPASTASSVQQTASYTYDAAGITLTAINSLNEQTVTTYDAIGRVEQIDVKNSSGTTIRTTSYAYSPDHHSVTQTEGTGGSAITTTTYTDTLGNTVVTAYPDGTFLLQGYDPAGNLTSTTDELSKTTTFEYDGLNRLRFQTLPDTAQVEFRYDAGSNLTHRIMPAPSGGSTYQWEALYDVANRMTSQKLHDGSGDSRTFSYAYYPAGDYRAGLLQTVTDPRNIVTTHDYDHFRRVQSAASTGSQSEHTIVTTFGYDNRGLLETIDQTASAFSSLVTRGYDGYGQLTSEVVTLDGAPHSDMAQQWDGAGRRESLTPTNAPSALGYAYRADGLMDQVTFDSQNFAFTYAANGLLTSRANPFRNSIVTVRDSRGRIDLQATTVNASSVLTESLRWQDNSRIDDYAVSRTMLGGNAPPLPNEYRNYTYNNDRGRLTSETFGPAATQSIISYEFDEGSSAGLGIRTQAQLMGGGYLVDASTVNSFARTTLESTDAEPKTFTATGNAFGAGEVALTLQSATRLAVHFPGWEDASGDWSADLTLPPGAYSLTAEATHPSGWQAPSDTNNFTVQATTENLTSTHDADGNTTTRSFSASGRVQTLTWDGLGRLLEVKERNGSNDGYDWAAKYDGLNRRLATSYQKIVSGSAHGSPLTANSIYDPQVEFLEIGLTTEDTESTETFWKVYRPDANGVYGGLQGIGGLEAIHRVSASETTGVIADYFGHATARTDGTVVTWADASLSGYGPLPGSLASPINQSGDLSTSVSWQGRYIDPTGYFCVGARYYEPNSGRFISADPLGHEASRDLYSYASGDPINMADPDGRFASGIYNGVGNNGNIGLSSPSSDSFYTGNIIGAAFGGYYEGLGQGAQNVSGYTRYQDHLSMFDGDVYNAANAAWNPAYLAAVGFYQAGSGTGLAPSNIGSQLDWVGRSIAGAEGVLGTVGTVGLAASATHFGSSTVGAFRQGFAEGYGGISTPYGPAFQVVTPEALALRSQMQSGGTVYKGGFLGRSEVGSSQFLAAENPLNPGYAARYGIPPENANFDFILTGRIQPGAPLITRPAPPVPPNPGGALEGVTTPGSFIIDSFHMP